MVLAEYFFLVLLVLVGYATFRARDRYFNNSRDSYGKLTAGILAWSIMLLLRVLGRNEFLVQSVGLDLAEYRYFVEAFFLVAGGFLLSFGASEWITHLTASDQRAGRYRKHMDLLSAATNAAAKTTNPEQLLDELRPLIMHFLGASSVNCYRFDPASDHFAAIDSHSLPLGDNSPLQHLCHVAARAGRSSIVPSESVRGQLPSLLVPIGPPLSAVILVNWEPGAHIDTDLLQTLDLLAKHLAGAGDTAFGIAGSQDQSASLLERLRDELAVADRIQDSIQLIDNALQQIMSYDILRIAVFDDRGQNVTQYSLGQGRNLLTERNHSISTHKTQLGTLFESPEVVCNSALSDSPFEDDRWLVSCGMRSALSIPILADGRVVAVVTLSAYEKNLDRAIGEKIAPALSAALVSLVKCDNYSHQLVIYNRQILDLTSTLKKLVSTSDMQQFLNELAETVVKKLPATYCRFWRYDSDKETLEFVADAFSRDVSRHVTETRSLPLAKARWHKLAIQAGRLMLINQREERMQMDDQELVQSLVVGLQSALLVPMLVGNEAIGIMAVAEMRNWDRRAFSLSDSLFARGIANMAAQAMMSAATVERVGRLTRQVDRLEKGRLFGEVFKDLPKRLATPLTSIMARTQQLIDSAKQPDDQTVKNLAIIKMQTEKMMNDVRKLQEARREQAF
jgi:GAF domain-containing protein